MELFVFLGGGHRSCVRAQSLYLEGSLSSLGDHLLLPRGHLLCPAIGLLNLPQGFQPLVLLQKENIIQSEGGRD